MANLAWLLTGLLLSALGSYTLVLRHRVANLTTTLAGHSADQQRSKDIAEQLDRRLRETAKDIDKLMQHTGYRRER